MLSQRKSPTIGFAALAGSNWIEHQTGWSIKKFIRTARRCRAAAIPGMTDKLLSQRLKDLEADGLAERLVHAGAAGESRIPADREGGRAQHNPARPQPVGAEMDRPTRRSLMRAHP
jgi:hypothetical protein